jgi:hypothetical protein
VAALAGQQVFNLYRSGDADRIALYAVRNVTSGDTADFATDFSVVKRATVVGATASGSGNCSVAGTVVTIPAALAADAAWLTVYGCAT